MITLLLNPFERLLEKKLIFFGLLTLCVGTALAVAFKARYDGVFDVHFVEKIQFYEPIIDNFISISCLTLFLFFTGKQINTKTRLIDILICAIIAKIPFYIMPFFNINNSISNTTQKLLLSLEKGTTLHLNSFDIILLLLSSIVSLAALVWSIILLYNGFKTATNLKKTKHIFYFSLAIILGEIITKIILYKIN